MRSSSGKIVEIEAVREYRERQPRKPKSRGAPSVPRQTGWPSGYETSGFELVEAERHHSFGHHHMGETWELQL
jgi:hypothetical protein